MTMLGQCYNCECTSFEIQHFTRGMNIIRVVCKECEHIQEELQVIDTELQKHRDIENEYCKNCNTELMGLVELAEGICTDCEDCDIQETLIKKQEKEDAHGINCDECGRIGGVWLESRQSWLCPECQVDECSHS